MRTYGLKLDLGELISGVGPQKQGLRGRLAPLVVQRSLAKVAFPIDERAMVDAHDDSVFMNDTDDSVRTRPKNVPGRIRGLVDVPFLAVEQEQAAFAEGFRAVHELRSAGNEPQTDVVDLRG